MLFVGIHECWVITSKGHRFDWISQKKAMSPIPECERIVEPIGVCVLQEQRPRLASIRGLVQPAFIARPRGHHDGRRRVPRLHAAKVQRCAVLVAVRDGALLPVGAAVGGLEYCPTGSAGPGNGAVHRIDPAQAGSRPGVLHLPDFLRFGPDLRRRRGWRLGCGDSCTSYQEQKKTAGVHGWKYSRADCSAAHGALGVGGHFHAMNELL